MKATENSFLQFLQGAKQFAIPIYQRTYSWTRKECRQFWDDVLRSATDTSVPAHFLGSIVYITNSLYMSSAIPELLVIDGQQRLTTVSLLLAALAEVLEKRQLNIDVAPAQVRDYFLFNQYGQGEQRYKLLLTQSDRETLIRLLERKELPAVAAPRLVQNYQFFRDQIQGSALDLSLLYKGLSKLMIVEISLERDRDNAQLIFESLNSTGVDLSQADLIRNFVLMQLEPETQRELYNDYWYPMERDFGHGEGSAHFDRFMRDYLTVKMRRIPNINEVYRDFKAFVQSQQATSVPDIVADIYRYGRYYANLLLLREKDAELAVHFRDISTFRVEVVYPFLLEVYDDYVEQRIGRSDFIGVLQLIETYLFRRAICGIASNVLNKLFAMLTTEIDKSAYLQSAQAALMLKTLTGRFPNDSEFRQAFMTKDVYNFRNRSYVFEKLENFGRREKVIVDEYTIEHILPQNENLSTDWQTELGPDWQELQATYLHTIGNLTLTGYNSELSDRSFQSKRDMTGGFAESPIRLSRSLARVQRWDEDAILERANELADIALAVWPTPGLSSQELSVYRRARQGVGGRAYRLEDHMANVSAGVLDIFEELRQRILDLDVTVREEVRKQYVAYKAATNFVEIVLLRKRLLLYLNISFNIIDDPATLCRDVTNIRTKGNGNVEVGVDANTNLDEVIALIRQSLELQRDAIQGAYQLTFFSTGVQLEERHSQQP